MSKRDRRTEIERRIDEEILYVLETIESQKISGDQSEKEETVKRLTEGKKQKFYDLEQLLDLVDKQQKIKDSSKVKISPDTILVGLINLLGIGLILGHEKLHVISSKALGFVIRGRV